MKKLILFILFIVLIIICIVGFKLLIGEPSVVVSDVTKEQVIMLVERNKPKAVHYISIAITGHIDGSAIVQRSDQDKKIDEPKMISGDVNLQLDGDWYSNECLIIYKPSKVTRGNLKIRWKFRTL